MPKRSKANLSPAGHKTNRKHRTAVLESLEQRVLFSADIGTHHMFVYQPDNELHLASSITVAASDNDSLPPSLLTANSLSALPSTFGEITTPIAFDDATIDSWQGALAPASSADITNSIGGGLSLNQDGGNDAYLKPENSTLLFSGLQQLTFEIQISSNELQSGDSFAHYRTATTDGFKLELAGTDFILTINNTTTTAASIDYVAALNDGEQHSVTTTWDSTTGEWQVFIDGELVDNGTGSSTTAISNAAGVLVLGQSQGAQEGNFDQTQSLSATLHEARIFSTVRSEFEIGSSHLSSIPWSETDLIANWTFDHFSSNGVINDSVAGNNLHALHVTEPGFTTSDTSLKLRVTENTPTGTVIGTVAGIDTNREAQINAIVASSADIYHSAETGSFYQVIHTPQLHMDAVATAQTIPLNGAYGQLLSINSATENSTVVDIMSDAGVSQTHLNATDTDVEGDWRWRDSGSLFWKNSSDHNIPEDGAYSNWSTTNPNNVNDQDVAKIFASDGLWDDVKDSATFKWIIKYDADSVLSSNGTFGNHQLTYAIGSQSVANTFTIDPLSGEISVANGANLNFEILPLHSIQVEITDPDGNSVSQQLDIAITDAAESDQAPTNLSNGIQINSDGGNDTYLQAANGSQILGGLDELTIEFILQLEAPPNNTAQTLLSYATAAENKEVLLQVSPAGNIEFTVNENTLTTIDSFPELYDGRLHTVSATWSSNNGVAFLYFDGILVATDTGIASGSVLETNGSLVIGNSQTSPGNGFSFDQAMHATLHDIRIWDHARTDSEISLNSYSKYLTASGLIANWQMHSINSQGEITDEINAEILSINHSVGSGFISSNVIERLTIKEKSAAGSTVGFVLPTDQLLFQDVLTDGKLLNENPLPTSTITVYAGDSVGDWNVADGSVDFASPTIIAGPNGSHAIELSGDDAGTIISTSFNTVPGQSYTASFAANANFALADTKYKDFIVSAAGQSQQYSIEHIGTNWINEHWERLSFVFTAQGNTAELSLQSLDSSPFGPYIADISVTEIPEAVNGILSTTPDLTYNPNTGKFYKFVDTPVRNDIALSAARAELVNGVSGQLFTVRSQLENELARQYAQQSGNQIWLGATRTDTSGTWNWLSGTDTADPFWTGGRNGSATSTSYASHMGLSEQPAEDYIRLAANGDWYDASNNGPYSYIIEWDAEAVVGNYTYTMTDLSENFIIDSNTGEITAATTNTLDFETAQSHTVSITVTDSNANTYSKSVMIDVIDVSSELSLDLPALQTTPEDTSLLFNTANGNSIRVDDDYGADTLLQTTLSVTDGVLQLPPSPGIMFIDSNGAATTSSAANILTISGTETNTNNALQNLVYTPDPAFNGTDNLAINTTTDVNLEAHYSFNDSTANDNSYGNIRNGTYIGGANTSIDSTRGTVLELTGSGDSVVVASNFGSPASISLGGWVNYSGTGQADFISLDDRLTISLDDAIHNGVTARFKTLGNNTVELHTDTVLTGIGWHHIFYVHDSLNGIHALYIDGEKAATATIPAPIDYTGINNTYLGTSQATGPVTSPATNDNDFIGQMDDIRVYSRSVSQDEIVGIINGENQIAGLIPINITAVNDAPYFTTTPPVINPAATIPVVGQTNEENRLTGLFVETVDIDSGTNSVLTTINVNNGIISVVNLTGTIVSGANSSADLVFTGTINDINTSLSNITFTPDAEFNGLATITIDINDQGNTGSGGALSVSETLNIQVNPVNDPPLLQSPESTVVTFTENSTPVPVSSLLSITDPDNLQLQSATVSIISGYIANEDELSISSQPNIVSTFDNTTGILTLSGLASITEYENALRDITYRNISENPTINNKQLSFNINDGNVFSDSWLRQLNVVTVNDAPSLSGITTTSLNYTENDGIQIVSPSIAITDADDTNINSATAEIINNHAGVEDLLSFTPQAGINGVFDSINGKLTFTGSASLNDYQTLLRSVTYQNQSEDPDTLTRVLGYTVNDGQSISNTAIRNISITPENDPPILNSIETDALTFTENDNAKTVSSSLELTDEDNQTLVSAVVRISTNYVDGQDKLQFSSQSGISGIFNSNTGTLSLSGVATVSEYQTALRSIRYLNVSDNPDTSTRELTITVSDGAATGNQQMRELTVVAVNDAPDISSVEAASLVYIENDPATPISSNIKIDDVDHTQLSSATVSIISNLDESQDILSLAIPSPSNISGSYNASAGVLSLTGNAAISEYQSVLRSVSYQNTSNDPDTQSRTVEFKISDENTDSNTDSNTGTRNIDLTPVNDAPTLTSAVTTPLAYPENAGAIPVNAAIAILDPDDTLIDSATIQISSNYNANEDILSMDSTPGITSVYDSISGTLSLVGTATMQDYQSALQSVSYSNSNQNPDTATRTIIFSVSDGQLTSNMVPQEIEIQPDNNAPAIANVETTPVIYTENNPLTSLTSSLSLGDADNTHLQSAIISINAGFDSSEDILNMPAQPGITSTFNSSTGQLLLSGDATLAEYETAIRLVSYTNNSENPGTQSRSITFTVTDGQHTSNTATRALEIIPVNDSPTIDLGGANAPIHIESTAGTIVSPALTVYDLDNTSLQSATVIIGNNYNPAEDQLEYINQSGIVGVFANGVLSLSGNATVAQYQQALRTVSYLNNSDAPDASTREISFSVNDGQSNSVIQTIEVEVETSNDAPELTNTETASQLYIEGATPVPVTSGITLNDLDNTNLTAAVISVVNASPTDDRLLFNDQSGITGTYDVNNGQLQLSGTASLADYDAAIRSVTYQNLSEHPMAGTRNVEVTVFDGTDTSNSVTRDLTVMPVNDAPIASDIELTPVYFIENSTAVAITDTIKLSDPDHSLVSSAQISISASFASAEDQLLFNDQSGITGNYNEATGELSLSGTATLIQYQDAIQSVRYLNISEDPSTSSRTVSITISDGQLNSETTTRAISIHEINDQPVLSDPGNSDLSFLENTGAIEILQTLHISDSDNATLLSATVSISPSLTEDQLLFEDQSGISGRYSNAGSILSLSGAASVIQYENALQSITYTNHSDAPSDVVRILSVNVDDGISSSNVASKSLTVIPVSDTPEGGDSIISIAEDSDYVFHSANFGFKDLKDGDAFSSIVITTSPKNGTLLLYGVIQPPDSIISIADISTGKFTFRANPNSTDTSNFGFLVQDSGNTLNGGAFTDPTENFIAIELTSINDAPNLINNGITVDEGSTIAIDTDSLTATDIESNSAQLGFTLLRVPEHGVLNLNGSALGIDDTFTLAQIESNDITYIHNGSETEADYFEIALQDGDSSLPVFGRFNITINESIDPTPVAADDNFTVLSGSTLDTSDSLTSILDNDLTIESDISLSIVTAPKHGTLVFNPDGTFIYHHDENSTATADEFTYRLTNQDNVSAIATVSISVEPQPQPELVTAPEPAIAPVIEKIPQSNILSIAPASVNTIPITGGTAQIISATEFEAVEPDSIQLSTQNPPADSGLETIEGFDRAAAINLASDNKAQLPIARFSLEALTTIQHNKHEKITVSSHIDSSTTNVLNVSINVSSTPLQVIDNENFSRSLSNLADDLQKASDQEKMRHDVNTDALFGVSFSLTAAFIGWTLRGGALLGSMLALQPLWASADPIKAASKIRDNDSTKEDSKLEEIFD